MRTITTILMIFLGIVITVQPAYSQVQKKISIQGILKDGDGAAVTDGNYDLTFTLYNAPTAGGQVWTEPQSGIQVRGGIYSVMLGSVINFNGVPFDAPYFLGVSVNGGTELTPRTELSYAPYALAVDNTAKAGGLYVHAGVNNEANKIVRTDGNGYLQTGYINSSVGNEGNNANPARVWGTNGTDDFMRSYLTSALGVATATNAGTSAALRSGSAPNHAMTFHWSAIGGQPTYYWGGNQGVDMNIYETGQLSVSHAATAGSASTAGGLTGIPNIQVASVRIDGIPTWPGTHGVGGPMIYMDGGSAGQASSGITGYSLVSVGRLAANAFDAYSDKRIKTNILMSNSASDLARLKSLEVVDYQYIDKTTEGNKTKKGFIAQQVASVFPEAVSYMQKKIPDVYALALSVEHEGPQSLITMEKEHSLKAGDKISLVTENKEELFVIKNCPSPTQFVVEGLDAAIDKIFVYGREIDDFHTIDDSMIFSLGISAIQQLTKQVADLEEENKSLKEQQADQVEGMALLFDRMNTLEKRPNNKSQSSMTTSEE